MNTQKTEGARRVVAMSSSVLFPLLFVDFINALVTEGIFPAEAHSECIKEQLRKAGDFSEKAFAQDLLDVFVRYSCGRSASDICTVGYMTASQAIDKMSYLARSIICKPLEDGDYLVLISSLPEALAKPFADILHFEQYLALSFSLDKDYKYTPSCNQLLPAMWLPEVINKLSFVPTTITGIGFSNLDVSWLQWVNVKRAVCIDPTSVELIDIARAENRRAKTEGRDPKYMFVYNMNSTESKYLYPGTGDQLPRWFRRDHDGFTARVRI